MVAAHSAANHATHRGQAFARRTRSPVGDRAADRAGAGAVASRVFAAATFTLPLRRDVVAATLLRQPCSAKPATQGEAEGFGGQAPPQTTPPAPRGRAVSAFAKARADTYAWMSMRPCDATHRFSRRRSSAFARRLRRTCPRCAQGTNAPSSAEAMEGFAGGFREARLQAPHAELGMIRQSAAGESG